MLPRGHTATPQIAYRREMLRTLPAALLLCLMAVTDSGCKQDASSTPVHLIPEVVVADVAVKDVPVYAEWVGSTDGMVNAVIKAQVSGYLIKQNYEEGAFVKKGHVLFEIDPRRFRAALNQAKSEWEKARAQFVKRNWTSSAIHRLPKEGRSVEGTGRLDTGQFRREGFAGIREGGGRAGGTQPCLFKNHRADRRHRGHCQGPNRRSGWPWR